MCCYYRCVTRPMIAKNATNAHVSSLYCSTRLYFCFSDIITEPERRIAYRPLLWWSGCPNNVAIICHLPHGVLCRPPSGYSLSSSLLVCSASRALGLCISLLGLFLCFCYYFIRLRVKEPLLYRHSTYARWRWDPFHSRIHRSHSCHASDTRSL